MAENGVIGRDGGLPWRLSTDMKRFKATTMGKPVVMGRKTFASIGRPLPGRPNIVVTRDPSYRAEGAEVVTGTDAALKRGLALASGLGVDEVAVIGGKPMGLPYFSAIWVWNYYEDMLRRIGAERPFASYDEFIEHCVKAKRDGVTADEQRGVTLLRERGMTVRESVDTAAFQAALGPAFEAYEKQFDATLIRRIRDWKPGS